MNIKLTLEPDADGTLHIPLPPDLREGKITVEGTLRREHLRRVKPGVLQDAPGPFWIAPDFDEPLEDFKEYME